MATTDSASDDDRLLEAAAEEANAGPRALMVRRLLDIVVLPAARISANERALTADILLQVVDKVELPLRVEIARRIARVPEIPPALLRMLLLDEPLVAREIIGRAETLPEALLIETARAGVTAHRALIAKRLNLTTAVVDAMLDFDEPDIAKTLLRRDDFTLSPHAVDLLVARSAGDRELQALVLRRRELEPAHGFIMFWWVDPERRRRILSRFSLDRTIIQDALQDLYRPIFQGEATDAIVKEILVMLDRRHRPRGSNGEIVSMDVVRRTLAEARGNHAQEIVEAVGLISGASFELAARILRDPTGEPYAVLCKAMGVPRDAFFGFLSGDSPDAAEALLAVFDSIARDFARAVLRYWDWDGNPRIAGITRLLDADAPAAL